jgi:hypothetical protein
MTTTPTRKDYMDGKVDFAEYYRSIAKSLGLSYSNADATFMTRVRQALANGDEHLNTIPLAVWDQRGAAIINPAPAFKAHGDGVSLAGLVCVVKQAARDAA